MPPTTQPELIVALVLVCFSALTYFTRVLSLHAIIFANALGIAAFALGGIVSFSALVVFYVVAEAATRLPQEKSERHAQRTPSNILGNGIAAIVALALGQQIGFFGAVSAALADTISSEIGMLSKSKPILITTLLEVERGTDGGVTLLGLLAAVIGGAIMGGIYYFAVKPSLGIFAVVVIAGFIGSLVDSFLGAVFERKGMLNNTQVNLIASISGGIFAALASSLI